MASSPAGQTGQDGVTVSNVAGVLQYCPVQSTIGSHHSLHRPVAGVGHIVGGGAHHVVEGLHVVHLADADWRLFRIPDSRTGTPVDVLAKQTQ